MTVDELLLSLNDIQEPVEPGWWPLGIGWWMMLAVILVLISLGWWLIRQRRFNQIGIDAAHQLEFIEQQFILDGDLLQLKLSMSRWVKQVSIVAFPNAGVDGYCGQRWIDFLNEKSGDLFGRESMGRIFRDEVYSDQNDIDGDELIRFCRLWLVQVKPRILAVERS